MGVSQAPPARRCRAPTRKDKEMNNLRAGGDTADHLQTRPITERRQEPQPGVTVRLATGEFQGYSEAAAIIEYYRELGWAPRPAAVQTASRDAGGGR